MSNRSIPMLLATALLAVPAAVTTTTVAGTRIAPATQAAGEEAASRLTDFVHYVLIAKPDLAEAAGRSLLDSLSSDAELADLVSELDIGERLDRAISRGRRLDGVSDIVADMEVRVENGRRELARTPARIKEAVGMLTGTLRQQMLGRERLAAAGAYAVPELLERIIDGRDARLEVAVTEVLEEDIRRLAVQPLCAALPSLDPNSQRKVSNILGAIGYSSAQPYLLELSEADTASAPVRDAARRAYERCGGEGGSVSASYTGLARRFFDNEEILAAYPDEPTNEIWAYDQYGGLTPTAVPTPVFHEVMAMNLARHALNADSTNANALSLFVASGLRRENDLPEGVVDPVYGDFRYSPQFFATATGVATNQDVLALAMSQRDTALTRDAIAAMGRIAGRPALFGDGARGALLDALRYPDRRVQYDASLVVANARPTESFPGDDLVVPLLGSAVRDSGSLYGVVLARDAEDRRTIANELERLGVSVIAAGDDFSMVTDAMASAPGLDIVVVRGEASMVNDIARNVRNSIEGTAAPIIAQVGAGDMGAVDDEFGNDRLVSMMAIGSPNEAFENAVRRALAASGADLDSEDALTYTLLALESLRDVAVADTGVLDVMDAKPALLEALSTRDGDVRLMVAGVLARMDDAEAQRAVFDAALTSSDFDQVALLDLVAGSARRFGNLAEDRQIRALRDLISASAGSDAGDVADAAGRAFGALDLDAAETVQLLID